MPVIIPNKLPAKDILKEENIFTIELNKALHQDIRALKIVLLNLMPVKEETETQLLRLLTNSPLQIELDSIHPVSHASKNTSKEHLAHFYKSFDDIKNNKYDGLIITGAPVEHLQFEQVDYWDEVKTVMDWSLTNVTSVLFICWAAQAGLYHFYKIPKQPLSKKLSGVYYHKILNTKSPIVRGFDDVFPMPHSRYTANLKEEICSCKELELIAESNEAGTAIIVSDNCRHIFVTGHAEYAQDTLKKEYLRDVSRGIEIDPPVNYFKDENVELNPLVTWRSHANLLFQNWLNYYVYQITPYEFIITK